MSETQPNPAIVAAQKYESTLVKYTMRPFAALLLEEAQSRPGERVVDVACGTGVVARLAAPSVGAQGAVVEVADGATVAVSVGAGVLLGWVVLVGRAVLVGSGVLLGWAVSVAATEVATPLLLATATTVSVAATFSVGAPVGAAAGAAQALKTSSKLHRTAG